MFLTIKWKKAWIFPLLLAIIVYIGIVAQSKNAQAHPNGSEILRSLGYDITEPPIEVVTVRLADAKSAVFQNYNRLQQESGFDLSPYAGKEVCRVTYAYREGDLSWRLNLLFDGDTFLGGDQCSVSLDGVMLPLKGTTNAN